MNEFKWENNKKAVAGVLAILMLVSLSIGYTVAEPPETVYYFYQEQLTDHLKNLTYDEGADQFTVLEEKVSCRFDIQSNIADWSCLYLDYESSDRQEDVWKLQLLDAENNVLSKQDITLQPGTNEIILSVQDFRKIKLSSEMEAGNTFGLDHVELRTQGKDFLVKKFLLVSSLAFVGLLAAATVALWEMRKRNWDEKGISLLQEARTHMDDFMKVLAETLSWRFSMKVKSLLRMGCFFFILLYMTYFQIQGTEIMQQYTAMHMWVIGGVLLIVAGLCYEDRKTEPDRSLLRMVTYLFLTFIWVSDFYMVKRYRYAGLGMVFMGGFFVKAWRSMEHPEKLAEEFKHAFELYFVLGLVYCIAVRPCVDGICYNGFLTDPVSFGAVALTAAAVFLDDFIRDNKKIHCETGAAAALYLVWKTQQLTLILTAALLLFAAVLFWFIRWIRMDTKAKGRSILLTFIGAAAGIACIMALQWILYHVPYLQGRQKVFGVEQIEELKTGILDVIRQHSWKGYFLDKCLDCKAYLQNINFTGYKSLLWIHKVSRWAGNSIIMNAYWYGMAAGIAYCLMTVLYGVNAIRESLKRQDFLMMGLPFIYILISMTEAIEAPFMNLSWYLFYLGLCYLFAVIGQRKQELKKEVQYDKIMKKERNILEK